MTKNPAPEAVIGMLACNCSHICKAPDCTCMVNGIRCTAACKLITCSNMGDNCCDDTRDDADDLSDIDEI